MFCFESQEIDEELSSNYETTVERHSISFHRRNSMIPYEMLWMIESRLRQLKNPDELFSGINVIVFSNLLQLPPVRGHQVFEQPERMVPALHLWRCFFLCELMENMRQKGDNTFIDILNALRVGELRGEHISILLQKVSPDSTDEFSIDRALRIYPTNQQMHDHNNLLRQYYRENISVFFTRCYCSSKLLWSCTC